jgi:hypothetical protein
MFHRRLLALLSLVLAPACAETPDSPPPERALAIHTDDGCRAECAVVSRNQIQLIASSDVARDSLEAEVSSALSARIVSQGEVCNHARTSCEYRVTVDTLAPGDVSIVFVGADGRRVDAISLLVRDPAKLYVDVEAAGPKQTRPGRSIVFRDQPIELGVSVYDERDVLLRYTAPPWTLASSDPEVVAPDPTSPAKVTLTAGSVSHPLELDVVEP